MTQDVSDEPRLVEIPRLAETPLRNLKGGEHIYYRQPNGWVTSGDGHKTSVSNYQEGDPIYGGGWVPLKKYGSFVHDELSINHPYDHLFRMGGAKEMPLQQLMEEGWAYRDYFVDGKKVEFPQLAGVTLPKLERCHHCGRTGTHDQIANHEEVQHQKDLAPQKMAEALGQALKGESTDLMVENTPQPPNLPFICGVCGQGFTGHMAIARHAKGEHPK